jgi:hypothetical protein
MVENCRSYPAATVAADVGTVFARYGRCARGVFLERFPAPCDPTAGGRAQFRWKEAVMAILSFNGRVDIAVERLRSRFPDAQLLEAVGKASAGLIEHPSAIDHLHVVFRRGDMMLLVEETGYGEFGNAVELEVEAPKTSASLAWPIEMDLPDADRLKEQFGYSDPYASVSLRVPLGVAWANASFVFGGNPQCVDVVVDTVTGKVRAGG